MAASLDKFPFWEHMTVMQIISKKTLRDFWTVHNQAEIPLKGWHSIVSRARWESPQDVRNTFNSADFIGDGRVVFNVGGNKYRIVARIAYGPFYRIMIKFVGTHAQYDEIDAETI